MVVSAIAIYQIIAGAIAAAPFIFHRLRVGLWSKKSSLQYPEVNDSEYGAKIMENFVIICKKASSQ